MPCGVIISKITTLVSAINEGQEKYSTHKISYTIFGKHVRSNGVCLYLIVTEVMKMFHFMATW
jgi:hypothetical protein